MDAVPTDQQKPKKFQLSLDYRVIVLVLIAVIVGMLMVWQPWQAQSQSTDRTISVTGESTVSAEPDEFVFYPSYEFENADKAAGLAELTKKSDEVVNKLKELGVPDSKIKTQSSGYNYGWYYDESEKLNHYTLTLTVTLDNLEQAQKIQDYLVTTEPSGSVSPQASFSDAKQKELESRARDEATKDARAKADQSANNLGFKVGKVKSVSDGTGFGDVMPMTREASMDAATSSEEAKPQLTVQPGENDLNYSVTVVYYVR